jgi:hypothetical protein
VSEYQNDDGGDEGQGDPSIYPAQPLVQKSGHAAFLSMRREVFSPGGEKA